MREEGGTDTASAWRSTCVVFCVSFGGGVASVRPGPGQELGLRLRLGLGLKRGFDIHEETRKYPQPINNKRKANTRKCT